MQNIILENLTEAEAESRAMEFRDRGANVEVTRQADSRYRLQATFFDFSGPLDPDGGPDDDDEPPPFGSQNAGGGTHGPGGGPNR